jgi:hypothetical protein
MPEVGSGGQKKISSGRALLIGAGGPGCPVCGINPTISELTDCEEQVCDF